MLFERGLARLHEVEEENDLAELWDVLLLYSPDDGSNCCKIHLFNAVRCVMM